MSKKDTQINNSYLEKRTLLEKLGWGIYSAATNNWVFYPVFVPAALFIAFTMFFDIGKNVTISMPYKYYIFDKKVEHDNLKVGDVVMYRYQDNTFYPFGTKFVKMVGGLPGDEVKVIGQEVYVNDKHIGTQKLFAGFNQGKEPLDGIKSTVIPESHYFLYTPFEHSFDSRYVYIGMAPSRSITGKSIFAFNKVDQTHE